MHSMGAILTAVPFKFITSDHHWIHHITRWAATSYYSRVIPCFFTPLIGVTTPVTHCFRPFIVAMTPWKHLGIEAHGKPWVLWESANQAAWNREIFSSSRTSHVPYRSRGGNIPWKTTKLFIFTSVQQFYNPSVFFSRRFRFSVSCIHKYLYLYIYENIFTLYSLTVWGKNSSPIVISRFSRFSSVSQPPRQLLFYNRDTQTSTCQSTICIQTGTWLSAAWHASHVFFLPARHGAYFGTKLVCL